MSIESIISTKKALGALRVEDRIRKMERAQIWTLKSVRSINGVSPDDSGNVDITTVDRNLFSATAPITYNAGTGVIGLSIPLLTQYGGTGSTITFTQGSIIFASGSGVYTQDNANFFWDDTNHFLGLGTASPTATIQVTNTQPASVATATGSTGVSLLNIQNATGGDTTIATTGTGGGGGNINITTGVGGQSLSALVSSTGGQGGQFNLASGAGGIASVNGTGSNTGGRGGQAVFSGGVGGAATGLTSGANTGGSGGGYRIALSGGGLASGSTTTNTGGNGGQFTITNGVGGASTDTTAQTNMGGQGGQFGLTAGTGGAASGAAVTNTGGDGGDISLTGGIGGTGTQAAGVGGSLTFTGGVGGVGGSAGGGGSTTVKGGSGGATVGAAGGNARLQGGSGSSTGSGGIGGGITVAGGNAGGDNTINRLGGTVAVTAGSSAGSSAGASISITSGTGGIGTVTTGATGGALTIQAGTGGANTTGGAGGNLTLNGGIQGAGGTTGGGIIVFKVAATTSLSEAWRIDNAGGFTNKGATATAFIHLAAGTATASTAPIKLTTGTLLGTPETGAIEFASSHLYFTIGSTRYQIDQQVAGSLMATLPLVLTGSTLSLNVGTGIAISGSNLVIDTAWPGQTAITTLGTIGTGTWNGTTIAVANGGTGQTTYTNGQLLIGNTSGNTLTKATLTQGSGITITNGNGSITIAATVTGAAGSDTQVQFNDGGTSFGGSANFTWNKSTSVVTVTGQVTATVAHQGSTSSGGNVTLRGTSTADVNCVQTVTLTNVASPYNITVTVPTTDIGPTGTFVISTGFTSAQVQTAINAVLAINGRLASAVNCTVTGSVSGGPNFNGTYTFTFVKALAAYAMPQMTVSASGVSSATTTPGTGQGNIYFKDSTVGSWSLNRSQQLVSNLDNLNVVTAPIATLEIRGSTGNERMTMYSYGAGFPAYGTVRAGGTQASPSATPTATTLGGFSAGGIDDLGNYAFNTGIMIFGSMEAFTSTTKGTNWAMQLTTAGTASRTEVLRMTNNGLSVLTGANSTARVDIAAGSATAGTAPLKLGSGTVLTTPESGAFEFNGRLYFTHSGVVRYSIGGNLFDHSVDAGNTTTGETDLYSDTIYASALNVTNDKLIARYAGIFVSSGTATREIRVYYGGTAIFDSGALSIAAGSDAWEVDVFIIRLASGTGVRCSVTMTTTGATTNAYAKYTEVTGLTLTNTQVLKITGQAGGVGAATNDIVAKLGHVEYKPVV